jgi:MFS transporter, DHA1 family, tetracycline resistance protein
MKTNAKYFVLITVLLDSMGIGLIIPVMPQILKRFVEDSHLQSVYFGYFTAIYALVQFFAAPILGNLSDAYGRRPVLLVSLLGSAIDYILMAFAPHLFVLFLGRIISGFTAATHSVAASCMADVSDTNSRAANFGLIGAGFGLGFIFGPALGGLLTSFGETAPFVASAVLCFFNFLFGAFVLPETLKPENRRKFKMSGLNSFKSLYEIYKVLPMPSLYICYFLLFLAGNVHPSNWTLYTMKKFNWSSVDVGLSLSVVGICIALFQAFGIKYCVKFFKEKKTIILGITVGGVGYFLLSFATQGWQAFALCVFFGFAGVAGPTLQNIFSKQIPANQQGALQGGLMALASLTSMIAPIAYSYLFGFFSQEDRLPMSTDFSVSNFYLLFFPGAAYLAASIFCFSSLLFYLKAQKQIKN